MGGTVLEKSKRQAGDVVDIIGLKETPSTTVTSINAWIKRICHFDNNYYLLRGTKHGKD